MLANAPQARVRQLRHPTPIRVQARSYSERAAGAGEVIAASNAHSRAGTLLQ